MGKARSGFGFPDDEQGGIKGIPFFKVSDMNADGNENEMLVANNYVTEEQITTHRWNPISDLPAIFFAKVGAAVLLNRKRLCRFPFLLDNNTMAYSLGNNYWDADFAKALFETIDLTTLVQVGALPSYNAGDVEAVLVCLPKLIEQRKIGCYFKEIDNLITLHQCKQIFIILCRFFSLHFFAISWEQRKLSELGKIETGNTPSTSISDYYSDNGLLWVTPTDITSNILFNTEKKLSNKGVAVARVIPENSILCTCIASIGKNAFLPVKCAFNQQINALSPYKNNYPYFLFADSYHWSITMKNNAGGLTFQIVNKSEFSNIKTCVPKYEEQEKIGNLFYKLDNLITLHQCEQKIKLEGKMNIKKKILLVDYYEKWIETYKNGAVRKVTLAKYNLALRWVKKLEPKLRISDLNRTEYQNLINSYAELHERQTTMDFHHQLKAAILDAVDEGLIERDPTRKVIIKGKNPRTKKIKYLNQYELHTLLKNLNLVEEINYDWLILLIAKTGMRFSEAIALTPKDFDFAHQCISINKTWDYKDSGGFQPTKNKSSIRKIQIDWMVVSQFSSLIKNLPNDKPIFLLKEKIYNSTLNDILERHCKRNQIPVITIHGLRHTHASLLLFGGVSIASVAKRLGHASMTTTQKIYIHIIQEMENKDVDLVMRSLSGLC